MDSETFSPVSKVPLPPSSFPAQPSPLAHVSSKGSPILPIFVVAVLLLAVGGVYYFTRSSSKGVERIGNVVSQVNPNKTPYQKLDAALTKTLAAKTAYIDFQENAKGMVTVMKTGLAQAI